MAVTSINIQPVKGGSELHNTRAKSLNYVRPDLSHLNESWQIDSIQNRLAVIKENYLKTTGQQMQKKATPIREGVIVIRKETTMEELQDFAKRAKERFGITAIQIHIHKDEGYKNAKEWTPNLHAHIVFDWTQANGESYKLNRQDMSELQTLLSLSLKMERGESSDVKHLSAIQFKNNREKERKEELSKEILNIEAKKAVKSAIFKSAERFKDIIGYSTNDKDKNALENEKRALIAKVKEMKEEITRSNLNLIQEQNKAIYNGQRANKAESDLCRHQDYIRIIQDELKRFGNVFNEEQKNAIKKSYPNLANVMEKGKEESLTEKKSKGFSR